MAAMVRGRFPLLGEPLSLDLINTRVSRGGHSVDLIGTPAQLDAWLAAEGERLPWHGPASAADLEFVRTLRGAVAELVSASRAGQRPATAHVALVNRAARASDVPELIWDASGPRLKHAATGHRAQAMRLIAADAVALLGGPQRQLIRTCAHPDCVLQFVASNPRRRWCSSDGCGNRARVARSYARQHAG
jgi:predicted RNA-binding Zn ribbon-like protein